MQNSILYTIPQWGIFLGIAAIIYAWIEKKRTIGMLGNGFLILLGIYALYAILTQLVGIEINMSEVTTEEILSIDDLPLENKLLPIYWGLVATGFIALISLILEFLKKKASRIFTVLAGVLGLALFFMVYGLISQ